MTRHRLTAGIRRLQPTLTVVAVALVSSLPASAETESSRLVRLLELTPGQTVADVGAGEGRWTAALSRAVGVEGRVFATEVEQELLDELTAAIAGEGLSNVAPLLGSQSDSGLPEACCDAILLRMVYHHFQEPAAMRESLRQALRPSGLLAVVDINPQRYWRRLEGVPERGGHGIEPQELIREMRLAGFEVVPRHDDWNGDDDRYCLVFRLRPPTSG